MKIDILLYIIFILYSININIYFYFKHAFDTNKDIPFFKEMNNKGLTTIRFMTFYQSIITKSNYIFIIIGTIGLITGVWF